jgi:hypothetical protein
VFDISKEAILRHIDFIESLDPVFRRGNRKLPTIKVFRSTEELLLKIVEGDMRKFNHLLDKGVTPGGAYNMVDNTLDVVEDMEEHVFVHELAHYLEPAGMTRAEAELYACSAQMTWVAQNDPEKTERTLRLVAHNLGQPMSPRIHTFRHDSDFIPDDIDESSRRRFLLAKQEVLI